MPDKARNIQEFIESLQAKIRRLEEEKAVLLENDGEKTYLMSQLKGRIEHLSELLERARAEFETLREENNKLKTPPSYYGQFDCVNADDKTVDVFSNGRRLRVQYTPEVDVEKLKRGQRVILTDGMVIYAVPASLWEDTGIEARVVALLGSDMVRVTTHMDEVMDVYLAEPLLNTKIREGDTLRVSGMFAYKVLPKSKEVEHLFLAEVPTVTYEQVGGLDKQLKRVRELIEWPYLYTEEFKGFGLKVPKGILLYGPPGCGKTLTAKAIANALGNKAGGKSYFMSIKGPELLNKWVGETERFIREVFARAKELATEEVPVIVFYDEMDALFPVRGSQVSSDTAGTTVPQFTTEMDGIEGFKNIIVIGATNREDRIDPAVIRPGRFDDRIEINRPDKSGSCQIFKIYLNESTVLHPQYFDPANYEGDYYVPKDRHGKSRVDEAGKVKKYLLARDPGKIRDYLIDMSLERIFDPAKELNQITEVTFSNGHRKVLYSSDFVSGAVIESIITRAKRLAFSQYLESGRKKSERGLKLGQLMQALEEEFDAQGKLPSVANPNEWASVFGIREPIVNVKSLADERRRKAEDKSKERKVKEVSPGHYL